jgi:hypothetical protein
MFFHGNSLKNISGTHFIRVNGMIKGSGFFKVDHWDYGSWKVGKDALKVSAIHFIRGTYGLIKIPK